MPRVGINIKPRCCGRFEHLDLDHRPTQAEIEALQRGPCAFCRSRGVQGVLPGTPAPEPEADLPQLTGSPAQISWALEVRPKKLREVEKFMAEWRAWSERLKPERQAQEREKLRAALDGLKRLEQTTSAHWWIEAKDLGPRELLAEVQGGG